MKPRSAHRHAAVATAAAVMITAGCSSTEHVAQSNALKISYQATLFTRNFNFLAPTNSAPPPGEDLVYEPLIRVSPTNGYHPSPWLASAWHWSDNGKTLTFKLRPNVTWSDGKKFTSKDVAYTLGLSKKYPTVVQGAVGTVTSVDTPNDTTAVVHYAKPAYAGFKNYYSVRILPNHLSSHVNPLTWTNPSPVGTGPFTMTNFNLQQITYSARSDYWGGRSKGVKSVVYRAAGTTDAVMHSLLSGKSDYAESPLIGNPNTTFVAKDPAHNHFWLPTPGASNALLFNNQVAPTNDVHVRRALYGALDAGKAITLSPGTSSAVANVTGVNAPAYADWIAPEFRGKTQQQDPTTAKNELKAGGYHVASGNLIDKAGKAYPLSIVTNPGDPWADAIASQIRTVLGITVKVNPTAQANDLVTKGSYNLAAPMPDVPGQGVPPGLAWNVDTPAAPGKVASDNWARANSPKAASLANQMAATNDVAQQKQLAYEIERIMVDQRFTAPISPFAWSVAYTTRHWKNWPSQSKPNAIPPNGRGDLITTVMNLTPAS